MTTMPHDNYLRLTDHKTYYETLKFHSQGNFCLHPATQHLTKLHSLSNREIELLSGNELRYNLLDEGIVADREIQPLPEDSYLLRNRSCELFSSRPVKFSTLTTLMSPLVAIKPDTYHRGYPSGGALYPIDVFLSLIHI